MIRSGMVLMAGIRRIARHGIGAGTATIRGIARGTTRGIIRGTIHGTTTAGVGTILIGAGACHTFTTLIAADQTRRATSLRAVPAAAHDSATPRHAHSAIHTDSATRHATTRASTTTEIRTSSLTVVPTMLSRNIATTASAAIVVASAEAIAAVVASAVVAVAVSAVEDNKGGSPSITI